MPGPAGEKVRGVPGDHVAEGQPLVVPHHLGGEVPEPQDDPRDQGREQPEGGLRSRGPGTPYPFHMEPAIDLPRVSPIGILERPQGFTATPRRFSRGMR
ncbi:MAG TPA: hypothetical protein VGR07_21670, partial [Thermoanaerobaculia bacterium]|nr:hypothetical protein [Thermoanaerobaculia bacterium]